MVCLQAERIADEKGVAQKISLDSSLQNKPAEASRLLEVSIQTVSKFAIFLLDSCLCQDVRQSARPSKGIQASVYMIQDIRNLLNST